MPGWYAVDERAPKPFPGERERERLEGEAMELAEAGAAYGGQAARTGRQADGEVGEDRDEGEAVEEERDGGRAEDEGNGESAEEYDGDEALQDEGAGEPQEDEA